MVFTATPVDGSSTPIPMSSAVPDTTNTPLALEGGPAKTTGGNSLAPAATYQYDGYNVVEGVTTDTAVTGDTAGTLSAKLRGLSKMLFDMWDSTNHWLQVKVMNGNANGQTTRSASAPVTLASDQTPLVAGTGTKSNVAGNAASVTILASNASRKGAVIYNDSSALLYLDLSGGTATTSSYSVQISAQGYFELPPQPIYTGLITGIWASATGNARVTELT